MRKIYTIFLSVILTASVFAQAPQKMSYRAVIRNSSNVLVTSTQVGMQISILQGSATGTSVYTETQTPTTNANGLVSIEIGGGVGFDTISWGNGPYFIKTETDPTGGVVYTITGISQLLSVPYALYSASTGDTTMWEKNGTDIYYNTGNVGIGTNSPNRKIDVNGGGQFRIDANKSIIFDDAGSALRIYTDDYTGGAIGKDLIIGTYPNGHSNQLYLSTTGNVGVGISTPQRKLHINDVLRLEPRSTEPTSPAKGDIYFDGTINKLRVYDGTTWQNCW